MITNSKIDARYLSHGVFSQLDSYASFYKSLAFGVMNWLPGGIPGTLSIDTYILSSIQGTIESVRVLLTRGRVNDAYALMRKYHDSAIINVYANLYLEDNFSLDNFVVQQIYDWVHGRQSLPRFSKMIDYIEKSDRMKDVADLLNADETYRTIRKRCDDHVHYNFFAYVLVNDNEIHIDRQSPLDQLAKDIEQIFIQHFAYLFTVKDNYMASSDYLDALEIGEQPEQGSQYFVAPFVQRMFDGVIKTKRPDVAAIIKRNTAMELE
jgi:hypothetical protein